MNKALFLDRDGVINKGLDFVYKIKDFYFQNDVFTTCKYFQENGYLIVIITNQGGIAKGIYSNDDFKTLTTWMIDKFKKNNILISKVYCCPHSYEDNCQCKKPKAGMILQAQRDFNIDLKNSILVGDQNTDIEAGKNAGIENLFLISTGHEIKENKFDVRVIDSLSELNKG